MGQQIRLCLRLVIGYFSSEHDMLISCLDDAAPSPILALPPPRSAAFWVLSRMRSVLNPLIETRPRDGLAAQVLHELVRQRCQSPWRQRFAVNEQSRCRRRE
jgi:hypothetical protein